MTPAPLFEPYTNAVILLYLQTAWDTGSAKILAALGAQAIGTTSAGFGFTQGIPDMGYLTRDQSLAHAADLVTATPLPVSGDFENGFGDDPETVAETVRLACEAGLAGCSIEDTILPTHHVYDFDLAVERIRAAASAARALPRDFVLVARADGIMNHQYDIDEALKRLQAFEAAGADCLYAPMTASFGDLMRICANTTAPVNALAAGDYTQFSRAQYADISVARISLGSALSRYIHQAIIDGASPIFDDGDFSRLGKGARGNDIDHLIIKGSGA